MKQNRRTVERKGVSLNISENLNKFTRSEWKAHESWRETEVI